jgi:hypothetical protein
MYDVFIYPLFLIGKLQKRKWENAMTLDRVSWGFRRDASLADFYTMEELLELVIHTIRFAFTHCILSMLKPTFIHIATLFRNSSGVRWFVITSFCNQAFFVNFNKRDSHSWTCS